LDYWIPGLLDYGVRTPVLVWTVADFLCLARLGTISLDFCEFIGVFADFFNHGAERRPRKHGFHGFEAGVEQQRDAKARSLRGGVQFCLSVLHY
jgi:hypothetical protein